MFYFVMKTTMPEAKTFIWFKVPEPKKTGRPKKKPDPIFATMHVVEWILMPNGTYSVTAQASEPTYGFSRTSKEIIAEKKDYINIEEVMNEYFSFYI